MQREANKSVLVAAVLALAAGCAGTQKIGQTSGRGPEDEVPGGAGALSAKDPLAATPAGAAVKTEKRELTDDEQEAFAKAVAQWQKARKEGLKGGECDDVADAFEKVADKHPNLVEARHNQAAVLNECGKTAEAVRIWEKLASGPKPYAGALGSLGYFAWKNGDLARAETMFERAVQADPQLGSVAARLNLAQIYRERANRSGSPEEKVRLRQQVQTHLRSVLAVDGNNLQAYATLCHFYFEIKLQEMARLVAKQAIWRAEEIATGKFVEEKGQLADVERAAANKKGKGKKGAAEADEPSPKASRETGVQGTGYTLEMKKNLGVVYNTLGLVWLQRKNVSEAIANFRRAVEMDPELHEARMNLGALSLNYRDYKTAEENFRAVLGAQSKNYEATIGLGVALRGNRKFDEAEQQYLAAQKLDSRQGDSYFNLGVLYQEYKGVDEQNLLKAQQLFRDFLGRGPSAGKRREAEKRIKDIDETIAALKEAAKLQREAEELQRKMEEQQKKMEEDLKKMQEQEKQQGTPPPAAAAPGPVSSSSGGAPGPAAAAPAAK